MIPPVAVLVVVGALAAVIAGGPVSPVVLALLAGVLVAHMPGRASGPEIDAPGRTALRLGIVLLGLRLSFSSLLSIGWRGALIVAATVAVTYTATRALGRRLGVEDDAATLVAVGFSICGAAAIAGVQDVVRARRIAVAQAVAMVTIFGSAMIVLLPAAARLLVLDERQSAVWAGASIHEVGQVVAAASVAAPAAIGVAVTVKLARVVLLAPMSLLLSTGRRDAGSDAPLVPWFVVGFLVAVAVRSADILSETVLVAGDRAATGLLAAGMFALGTGVHVRLLRRGSGRMVALAAGSTLVAAVVPLSLVAWLI